MARRKDVDWFLPDVGTGISLDHAKLAVLMDLRDELKRLNGLLHCSNFIDIPRVLSQIRKNTTKSRRKAKS